MRLSMFISALNEVGSEDVNHNKISETILHLIPDETLQNYKFEWASTEMMTAACGKMFKITKSKVETFLHGAMGLHLGIFYGMLFEPCFHEICCAIMARQNAPSLYYSDTWNDGITQVQG